MRPLSWLTLLLMMLVMSAASAVGQQVVRGHCQGDLTLRALIDDMAQQNLVSDAAFWGADLTRVHLLLADASEQTLEALSRNAPQDAPPAITSFVYDLGASLDLALPQGGPLLPRLGPQSPDLEAVESMLQALIVLGDWADQPFDANLDLAIFGIADADVDIFRALWAQARTYAGDPAALAYVVQRGLIIPRAVGVPERFRPDPRALGWSAEDLHAAIFSGEITWVAVENVIWGWLQRGDRIRMQAFARLLRSSLLELRTDFIADRPNFEGPEPFSGYFTSWQRWEDLSARLFLMLGRRGDVPAGFFHQTLALGFGESEPNVAILDASQLYAAWQANGFQSNPNAGAALAAQREGGDARRASDLFAFFQVLTLGTDLGLERLVEILTDLETSPNARWVGGPSLMRVFLGLERPDLALRAAELAAEATTRGQAPYDFVTPLIRQGQIELARQVLAAFHRQACNQIASRSDRTYLWIDWLPLVAAGEWHIPASRLDGI